MKFLKIPRCRAFKCQQSNKNKHKWFISTEEIIKKQKETCCKRIKTFFVRVFFDVKHFCFSIITDGSSFDRLNRLDSFWELLS